MAKKKKKIEEPVITCVGAYMGKKVFINGDEYMAKSFRDIFVLGMKSIEILENMKNELEKDKLLNSKPKKNASTRKTTRSKKDARPKPINKK